MAAGNISLIEAAASETNLYQTDPSETSGASLNADHFDCGNNQGEFAVAIKVPRNRDACLGIGGC